MNFGTNKIEEAGAEAAPIDFLLATLILGQQMKS